MSRPELEPLEDVPPGKTRLYVNFSTSWPIRPSIYFMKQAARIIERRAQSARLAKRDLSFIAGKMSKKYPEGGYDLHSCQMHWRSLRDTAVKVRRATGEGCGIDEEKGLLTGGVDMGKSLSNKYTKLIAEDFKLLKTKNLMDVFKYLELADKYGTTKRLVISDAEEEDGDGVEEDVDIKEDHIEDPDDEFTDFSEYELVYENEPQPDHKFLSKSINLILPVAKDDKKKTFDVEKFSTIAQKDQDDRPTKKVKLNAGKGLELKQAIVRVKRSTGKTEVTCAPCHSKSSTCTREVPSCTNCRDYNIECSYPGIKITKKKSSRKSKMGLKSETSDTSESETHVHSSETSLNDHYQRQPRFPVPNCGDLAPHPKHQQDQHPQNTHKINPHPDLTGNNIPLIDRLPPQHQHRLPPPPPQAQFVSQQMVHMPGSRAVMPQRRVPLVLTPEEIEQRRKAVASMIKFHHIGHFTDRQLLEFAREKMTFNYVEDFNLFKGAPDVLLAQILRNSVKL